MSKQDSSLGRQWFVIHTYSGYEDAVKKALEQRMETMGMQEYIFEVVVPKEKIRTLKAGKPVIQEQKMFPGYVLVNMVVTDASWFVVRNTPNVTGFVGSGNTPVPVLPEEFGVIERRMGDEHADADISMKAGDLVTVKEGPFANYEGIVHEVSPAKAKVTVMVSVFDRETPLELDFEQVIPKL